MSYITVRSGRKINPFDLKREDIKLEDIAFSLCHQCRFMGHVPFYSVAQHCLILADEMPEYKLQALMHDASEAYLGDIATDLKKMPEFAFYRDAEARAMKVISEVLGFREIPEEVHRADKELGRREYLHFFHRGELSSDYLFMDLRETYRAFLAKFKELSS